MSCAKLKADLLAAREVREVILSAALTELAAEDTASLVFVSMAIPGRHKDLAGSAALFRWALAELGACLKPARLLRQDQDILGPYAILHVGMPAPETKRLCMAVEDSRPSARLLDLDVYHSGRRRLGRVEVGEPPRACLLCEQPAADCIRLKRHSLEALVDHANDLLTTFRGAVAG